MGKVIDITGQKFGKLTARYVTRKTSSGNVYWRCDCDCGNTVDVLASYLRNGTKTCCRKCNNKMGRKPEDITGQKFGMLTAISFIGAENGKAVWLCQCDCGKMHVAKATNLKTGNTISCGCVAKGRPSKKVTDLSKIENLEGYTIGKLTILQKTDYKCHGEYMYTCKCKCGTKLRVSEKALRTNKVKSCTKCRVKEK